MTPLRLHALVSLTAATVAVAVSGCGSQESDAAGSTAVAVAAADDSCDVQPASAPAGPVTFSVTNNGAQVTEFYLYAEDGDAIVGEVENIGPGISREFTVSLDAGTFVTACKPGMSGDGIRGEFTATGAGAGTSTAAAGNTGGWGSSLIG